MRRVMVDHQCLEEGDQRLRSARPARDIVVAARPSLAAMRADHPVQGRHVAAMAVGRRRGDAPQFRRSGTRCDRRSAATAIRCRASATCGSAMTWRFRSPNSGTRTFALVVARQFLCPVDQRQIVDARRRPSRAAQRACGVERAGVVESQLFERQRPHMAARAANVSNSASPRAGHPLPSRHRPAPSSAAAAGSPATRPAPRHRPGLFICHAIAIEIVLARPARTEAFDGLDAVMLIERIDGELA